MCEHTAYSPIIKATPKPGLQAGNLDHIVKFLEDCGLVLVVEKEYLEYRAAWLQAQKTTTSTENGDEG